MSAEIHVYVDPARLAQAPEWSGAILAAGFDLELQTGFDLTQSDGPMSCSYRGAALSFGYRHEPVDEATLGAAGAAAPRSRRLCFAVDAEQGAARVPALICAAVVCARLDGVLVEADTQTGEEMRVEAPGAIAWATDFEALSDEQYRRAHDGQEPPFLLARRRRRRRLLGTLAGLAVALPMLTWAGLRLQAHYQDIRDQEAMRLYRLERDRQYAEYARQKELEAAAKQAAREVARAKAAAEAAALEQRIAQLSDQDYAFTPVEMPAGRQRWLFGYRQPAGHYAFDLRGKCGKEVLHSDEQTLFPGIYTQPSAESGLPAVTVPALALAPLRAAREHLPRIWTVITTEGSRQIEISTQATSFSSAYGPCLYLLSAPFAAEKQKRFRLVSERWDHAMLPEDLVLAFPGALRETALRATEPMTWPTPGVEEWRHQHQIDEGMGLLRSDARLRVLMRQVRAQAPAVETGMRVAGYQDFRATFAVERPNDLHRLYFYRSTGTSSHFWAVMRMYDQKVVAASVEIGSFVPELAATVDVDGDGTDELLFRTYLYDEGKMLKLLKLTAGRLSQIAESSYTGI